MRSMRGFSVAIELAQVSWSSSFNLNGLNSRAQMVPIDFI